jgi:hypothetical protein
MRGFLLTYPLGEERDRAVCKLNDEEIFTVKSMYKKLIEVRVNIIFNICGRKKIHLKSKFGYG